MADLPAGAPSSVARPSGPSSARGGTDRPRSLDAFARSLDEAARQEDIPGRVPSWGRGRAVHGDLAMTRPARPHDERRPGDLVREISVDVVEQVAPEELPVFEETASEYFADPDAVLNPRRRDEAVGFGLDAVLATPLVLAVVTHVLQYLGSVVVEAIDGEVRPWLVRVVRRLLRRKDAPEVVTRGPVPRLTPEQVMAVRDVARARARALGVQDEQADLLADAIVGRLVSA